jgi:hypothetical protein
MEAMRKHSAELNFSLELCSSKNTWSLRNFAIVNFAVNPDCEHIEIKFCVKINECTVYLHFFVGE